jgi:hypothetical protein
MKFSERFFKVIEGTFHGGLAGIVSCLARMTWNPTLIYFFIFFGAIEGLVNGGNVSRTIWGRMNFGRDCIQSHETRMISTNNLQEWSIRKKESDKISHFLR